MSKVKLVLAGILGLLLLIVVIQNTEVVTVTLLLWNFEMSRVILIVLATMTGFVGGYVVGRLVSGSVSA